MHHLGFVVASISASIEQFQRSLTATWNGQVFEDCYQRVRVTFLQTCKADPQFELVEPCEGRSPVRKFLEERGGGLHHICYEVDNIEKELEIARLQGAWIVARPKPAVAFGDRRIAWVLTKEKLLIEFLERELSPHS